VATNRYNKWLAVLKEADAILARRAKQEKDSQTLFDAGDTDRLTLLTSQIELNNAELSRLDSFVSGQQALGLLEDAVMQPLVCPENLQPIVTAAVQ
jgi:cobalt-zinc-cadmium efflux system outer membrane protein